MISFYIDDDADEDRATATPTFSMTLLELAGEGSFTTAQNPQDGSPYSLALMGKTAVSGGVFSTMRIPFQRRLRTTIQADPSAKGQSVYWMIIRGMEAYPVVRALCFVETTSSFVSFGYLLYETTSPKNGHFSSSDISVGCLLYCVAWLDTWRHDAP